ncbi:N-acetylmuramoyl-L-alanine amidase [Streptomyces sp. NPDC058855]|uniref:N-acetylmuramoyl-L-alanine amidase n=1 Tax=Streptomyces sp. NPDC058855 TaxID=3346651 RepID=UPI0036B33B05
MMRIRTSGRRLSAVAVTAVLAATGGVVAAVPATAAPAPAAVAAGAAEESAVRFPVGAEVVGAGTTGFLSRTRTTGTATPEYRWTRFVDGSSTVLPPAALVTGGVSDVVVRGEAAEPTDNRVLTLHDMAAPSAAPVRVDLDLLGANHYFTGAVGSTLVVLVDDEEAGPWRPHLVTMEDGKPVARPVTGLPDTICDLNVAAYAAGTAVLDCGLGVNEPRSRAVVDLATAAVVSAHPNGQRMPETAVSATHVAWEESDATTSWVQAARIGSAESRRIETNGFWGDGFQLLGSWLAYGEPSSIDDGQDTYGGTAPRAPRPYVARSLDTGEKVPLLTHYSSAVPAPDGSLLVRGGDPATGEGLYRVAPGADGRPAATLVAPTGQATAVTLLGTTAPTALTGAQLAGGVDMTWDLSRGDVFAWVTLVHTRTGQRGQWPVVTTPAAAAPRTVSWHWNGKELTHPEATRPALNGEYTWELHALPDDGIGPELRSTGRFTVTRPLGAHDYDDNGTADVFVRDNAGGLALVGTQPASTGDNLAPAGAWNVGTGWQIYDRVESAGNVAGTSAPDTVARDTKGDLWLYQGTGDGARPLSGRIRIGTGWGIYQHLAGGSDLTGDGRADLLATDKAGGLWLYPGTGNTTAPLGPRRQIGTGWGVYNQLTATGDLGGAAAGDLLARDADGVLWLYLGKGDGTFAPRARLGAGWNAYTDLVGIGDGNGDGRADLLAANGKAYFYAGTGDWSAPFKPVKASDVLPADLGYNTAF